jgi:aldehyde dehydrogenase (NAD+)
MQDRREKAEAWAKQRHALYIDGRWVGTRDAIACIDPTTERVVGEAPLGDVADVDAAVDAARRSFKAGWGCLSRTARAQRLRAAGRVIRENAEELAGLISLENGKLFSEALNDDMPDTADVFDYYAGWTDKFYGETAPVERGFLNYITRAPVGVCGLIVPWNYPLLLAAWKLAAALAMGNTAVVKPSENTPLSMLRLADLLDRAEIFPAGTINVVTGAGETGDLLARHGNVDKISFTGSAATGRKIVTASGQSNLKTVTLELGGKAPVLLFADAPNLQAAIERCFAVAYSHKGEKCTEPARLLIEDSIYDGVACALAERAAAVRCGDPFEHGVGQGPQCGKAQYEKITGYIEAGIESGARLLAGGTPKKSGPGYYVPPTLFGDVDQNASIAREEIFGPVLVLQRFRAEDEAVTLANDSKFGLAAGLYTSDLSRAHRVAAAIEAGQVFVNRYGCYDFASPFGGFKQSGWGKEMGVHSLEAYTRAKSVWIAYD